VTFGSVVFVFAALDEASVCFFMLGEQVDEPLDLCFGAVRPPTGARGKHRTSEATKHVVGALSRLSFGKPALAGLAGLLSRLGELGGL
jgi:hypothetical protein